MTRRFGHTLSLGLTGLLLVAGGAMGGGAVQVRLEPRNLAVEAGAVCTLQVVVDTPDSLSCMECAVVFDDTLLTLLSVEEGALFQEAPFSTFFDWDSATPAKVTMADCVMGYQSYFLPPGDVVRLVFRAEYPGVARVHIEHTRLWDIDRVEVATNVDPPAWIVIGTPTSVESARPPNWRLRVFPNPFNRSVSLSLAGPWGGDGPVQAGTLSIYDASGGKVRELSVGGVAQSMYRFVWDGRDDGGRPVAAGVYFAAVEVGGERITAKLAMIR